MTNFPPETYLVAARIADPDAEWTADESGVYFLAENPVWSDRDPRRCYFDLENGNDYRALREALDKEYGIFIRWTETHNEWLSCSTKPGIRIDGKFSKEIVPLMLENVQALIEAGVVE